MSWCCDKCLKTIYDKKGNESTPFQINKMWLGQKCYDKERAKGLKRAMAEKRMQLVKDIKDIDSLIKRAVDEGNVAEGKALTEHRACLAMGFEVLDDLMTYDSRKGK